jgi:predicted adenylyl cyclase CyaB
MPTNLEIKAHARDFNAIRSRAELLSDTSMQVIPQVDTFFATKKGRLKLRELGPGRAQLIYYERPDQNGPKRSDYHIFETSDPVNLKATLSLALGARGVVRKTRYLFLIGQTRIHLDDVEGLGHFMELEVVLNSNQSVEDGQAIAEDLMLKLGVDKADLLEGAYMDLIEKK